jgi:hypothetical protein
MVFRPIAELLSESLEDKKEITTYAELVALVDKSYYEHPLQITWENQGYDNRIQTDSWIIMCMWKDGKYEHPQAAGFTHDDPSKLIGYNKTTEDGKS